MKASFASACTGLLIVALAAGCGTTQAPSVTRSAAASPSVSQPAPGSPPVTVPVGMTRPPGGPVPAGFKAASVTFVSTREAFALGTAPCKHAPCTSIVRTRDRGVSWRGLPAPAVPLREPRVAGPALWGIRFATPEHGFVFGNGLWVTADGGEHWSAAAYPGGAIMSLEITSRQVMAVTMRRGAAGNASWALLRRPLAGGAWTALLTQGTAIGSIATQAQVAAILDGSSVLVTRNAGLTITRHPLPCTTSALPVPTSIAVEAPTGLALLCTGQGYTGHTDKTVYVSSDLGASWKLGGHPASAGDGGMIAASAPGHLTIATTSAASWLYYSADNGKTWRSTVTYPDGGQGWDDLGFTTTRDGVVIHGHPYYGDMVGQLLLTGNGGQTWHAVTF
jgi:BNR/Asp-box repeat